MVYVREAHAIDSAMPMDFGLVEDPIDDQERVHLAGACVAGLDLPMTTLVDHVDDRVGRPTAAGPTASTSSARTAGSPIEAGLARGASSPPNGKTRSLPS
jgi:hypothetical protein